MEGIYIINLPNFYSCQSLYTLSPNLLISYNIW